jgi:hypothetical protein
MSLQSASTSSSSLTRSEGRSPRRHPLAHPKGGMCLVDEGGVIPAATKDILSKVASKLIKVQLNDILKLSAPAFVHCPRTYLECAAMDLSFSPDYLRKAALEKDPIARLKLITCMYVGGQHISPQYCQMRAPLNPVLGETLQREMADGTRFFAEQTSHHPPITNFYLDGPGYRFSGYFEYKAWLAGFNAIGGARVGKQIMNFDDGGLISIIDPTAEIQGLTIGDKVH